MAGDLMLLGKGHSSYCASDYLKAVPDMEIWTLNDAGRSDSSVHFDVHEDRRFWRCHDMFPCRWVVSPFAPQAQLEAGMERFPLEECHDLFGHAYFECSFDYMLAMALIEVKRGTRELSRVWVPGFDMADGRHYTFRPGAHFWLGVAVGMGIKCKIPAPALLLKRVVTMKPQKHGDPEFPHAYGQTPASTSPLVSRYGWR